MNIGIFVEKKKCNNLKKSVRVVTQLLLPRANPTCPFSDCNIQSFQMNPVIIPKNVTQKLFPDSMSKKRNKRSV